MLLPLIHTKIGFCITQLKKWLQNPTSSFNPTKNFKVSFGLKRIMFGVYDYTIKLVEAGITYLIPATLCQEPLSDPDLYRKLMTRFITAYNTEEYLQYKVA